MNDLYPHPDYLGNTEFVTDLTGRPYQHWFYNPFGEELVGQKAMLGDYDSPYRFNAKEVDPETGLHYYGARYYNSNLSLWISVDPLADKYPSLTPYAFVANNPVMLYDPDGMRIINFDENGNYTGTTKDNWWHNLWNGSKGMQTNSDGSTNKFRFSDPKNDVKNIQEGKITKLINVSENQVESMLSKAGAFNSENRESPASYLLQEGPAGGQFDFSFEGIPEEFNISRPTLDPNGNFDSPYIFLVDGVAHNHMNFGNFMFGAGGATLGVHLGALRLGAHYRALTQDGQDGYPSQLDSRDDQFSIMQGYNYARGGGILNRAFGNGRAWDKKNVGGSVDVGPIRMH